MVYLSQPQSLQNAQSAESIRPKKKDVKTNVSLKPATQYRMPTDQKDKASIYRHNERSVDADQRQSIHVLFDNINSGRLDKRSNSQPSVDNVQLKLKPNIIEPAKQQKERLLSMYEAKKPSEVR